MAIDNYTIYNEFLGYINKFDITNVKPGYLVRGSKNFLLDVSNRLASRKGYRMDGPKDTTISSILSSFDWQTKTNSERHLRAGGLTSALNDGKLQYRYVASDGTITWRDLATGLTSTRYNFCTYWNETELLREVLYVNGSSNVFRWNGAVTTIASNTANTITKQGTTTWAQEGFYTTGNKVVRINGVSYTYTGGENTTTLTGLAGLPAFTVGDVAHQQFVTTAVSTITGMPATFTPNLIENFNNQVYYGYTQNQNVYVSAFGDYTDVSFTAGGRLPTEGALARLDAPPVAFIPQDQSLVIGAGLSQIYNTSFILSADQTKEAFSVQKLQVTFGQAPQSQALITKIKNDVIMITNEPTMDTLGNVTNILGQQQTQNYSDQIKIDFDSYDFTDGSIFYFKNFIYVAVPVEGLVLVYNIANETWEAPQTIPVSRFYVVDNELHGHGYNSSESYKLFTGYADRATTDSDGTPIDAVAYFSYLNFGTRSDLKTADEYYVEGYIQANTTLTAGFNREIDGCQVTQSFDLSGDNSQVVCLLSNDNSLGKFPLGKNPLGSNLNATDSDELPPKFRVIFTYPKDDFYEIQPFFAINGVNQRFELLAFGFNASMSPTDNVAIKI